MKDLYGFIMTRHVNSELTNKYWNQSVKLLRTFYPLRKIVIIDDNSNYEYVKSDYEYKNIEIIQSEFPGRGELLPYYYFLKHKFFQNAIIIHDGIFIHKYIAFELLKNIDIMPLWFFYPDKENIENTNRILNYLKNNQGLYSKINNDITLGLTHDKWFGCFGVQSYISLPFLERIEQKYNITNLINAVKCRSDRCCLERIFGCIFYTECPSIIRKKSLLGNIMKYHKWGYNYNQYEKDFKQKKVPKIVIKVWTGR